MLINNKNYEIIKNEKDGFVEKDVEKLATEYFYNFDYIVGDWAYGKLRLKGFFEENNKNKKSSNDINNVDKYISEKCAFGCKYFILKKID